MAKVRANKNKSYREKIRKQQELEEQAILDKKIKSENALGILMFGFAIVTLALVVLAIFKLIGQPLPLIWMLAEIVYGFVCIVGYIKDNDKCVFKMAIVSFACAVTSFIAAVIA
jgi:hypothetical protein